jgi:pimeloyl-ACP methyl ester carboxylesterase
MPDGDVSLGIQNDVFAAFVSHVGARNPHVVAHDFGGATALRAHLLNGLDYASLTLIDAVSLRPWGSAFVQHVNQHEAAFAGMPAYMHEALLYAYIPTALHGSHSRETIAVYAEPWQTAVGQAGFYRQIAQMDVKYTDDVESRYKDIRCPVQILWGEADGWLPIEVGRRLHAAIPGSTFIPIAGAGHLVQEDRPEAIAHAVQRFLTGRD